MNIAKILHFESLKRFLAGLIKFLGEYYVNTTVVEAGGKHNALLNG